MAKVIESTLNLVPGTLLQSKGYNIFLVTEARGVVVNIFNGRLQGIETLEEPIKQITYQEIMW